MDLVAQRYRQSRVHVVLDNLNTHKDMSRGAFLTASNRAHGERLVFHYTPTPGSWLQYWVPCFQVAQVEVAADIVRQDRPSESVAGREAPMVPLNEDPS